MRTRSENLLDKKRELERRIADAKAAERRREGQRESAIKVRLGVLLREMLLADPSLRERVKREARRVLTRKADVELFRLEASSTYFDELGSEPTEESDSATETQGEGTSAASAAPVLEEIRAESRADESVPGARPSRGLPALAVPGLSARPKGAADPGGSATVPGSKSVTAEACMSGGAS